MDGLAQSIRFIECVRDVIRASTTSHVVKLADQEFGTNEKIGLEGADRRARTQNIM